MTASPPPPAVGPELIAAVQRGDSEALDAWYRAEHPVAHRLCFGFLADRTEADDAAQDAMLHLLDRLAAYDGGRPYPAWRTTVVLNHCRDRLRRAASRRAAEDRAPTELPARLPERPEEIASAHELLRLLSAALTSLTPREREAFVLRDLEGHSSEQVADALGITESSVRSLVTLARRRLRQLLGPRLPASVAGGAR